MIKILRFGLALSLAVAFSGCRGAGEIKPENSNVSANALQSSKTPEAPSKTAQTIPVDVATLAQKSIAGLDEIFGAPQEASSIAGGGEFRLYKIAGQAKGLAVRFYGGRAKSFNLIADAPLPTSKAALKQLFNIDVGNSVGQKNPKEPLTESYQGTFGGVKFKKVSAKKQESGKGFIFVLAEVAE